MPRPRSCIQRLALLLILPLAAGCTQQPTAPTPPPIPTATSLPLDPTAVPAETLPAPDEALPSDQEPSPEPTTPIASPTAPLPVSDVGASRSAPAPTGSAVQTAHWEVTLLGVQKGEAALTALRAVSETVTAHPEGSVYLLANLQVTSRHTGSGSFPIGPNDFKVTGDRLQALPPASVAPPAPALPPTVPAGETVTGWLPFLVGADEGNLMLMIDEVSFTPAGSESPRFLAIDPGASLGVPADLGGIAPGTAGQTPQDAVAVGGPATSDEWEIRVLESRRGAEALALVQPASPMNRPPADGQEFVAVRASVRLLATDDRLRALNDTFFNLVAPDGTPYDRPNIIEPAPALQGFLFPGGQLEGWLVFQAPIGATPVALRFEPLFEPQGQNRRFLALP